MCSTSAVNTMIYGQAVVDLSEQLYAGFAHEMMQIAVQVEMQGWSTQVAGTAEVIPAWKATGHQMVCSHSPKPLHLSLDCQRTAWQHRCCFACPQLLLEAVSSHDC